ncbi:MAG: hypothetical protein ACPGSB_06715 [Opitutales bacterium]
MKSNKTGSGLFLMLIISSVLAVGIYSVLDLANTEFRLNKKATVFNEAKHASESLIQASMADLKQRFEKQTAFPIDALSPSNTPLYISNEFVSMYSGTDSNLIIPTKLKYTSKADFNSQETEIIGGQIPPGEWRYIDPRIPGNEFDELAGTRVFERNIELVSKATVDRPATGKATVYARQFLQVRDAPLFAYAIFYNLPMEIAPGPEMQVFGNVHSNGDTWFQSNNSLDFFSRVTTAGDFNHGRHPDSGKSNSNGRVRFPDGSDNLVNMKEDGSWGSDQSDAFSGGWLTSAAEDFYDLSNQLWDGNVQTGDHGVQGQNPVGVMEYVEDTDPTTDAKESLNNAYVLIQPVLNKSELTPPDQSSDPEGYAAALIRQEVEKQKYSYKAGLTIQVESDGDINYLTYERDSNGDLQYESDGKPKLRTLSPTEEIASYRPFKEEDGEIVSGMHDKRQAQDLNMIEIDVGKLKELIHADDSDDWGGRLVSGLLGVDRRQPKRWWNGVVYVEFPTQESTSSRADGVNPAIEGWGVKVKNGEVIPNPDFARADGNHGLSLATNQMMYVQGNYNSDGDRSTGSPTEPDDLDNFAKQGHEAPAALIADSLTFLSEDWDDADSNEGLSERKAADTEVSAAILTGLVPSGETGTSRYSGGVENFPRFLEKWGTLRLRGSIVALFESEVGTREWGYGGVYGAPKRNWGFHSKFAEGYLPPGTPNTRRYRAVDFELVDKPTYDSYVERIKQYF